MVDVTRLRDIRQVNAEMICWLTVHGNLCLALRHPSNVGESRRIAIRMLETISRLIVDAGVMTQEEIDAASEYEVQEGGPWFGAPRA
jgi:hypothetical protein